MDTRCDFLKKTILLAISIVTFRNRIIICPAATFRGLIFNMCCDGSVKENIISRDGVIGDLHAIY